MQLYIPFPSWISPEIIPGFPVRWYALMYLIAFGLTYVLVMHQVKKRKLSFTHDDMSSLFMWVILGLLLGARLFAALFYDPSGFFLRNPWMIFWPFRNGQFVGFQGMSYHGGLVGAVVGGYLYSKAKNISFLQIADLFTAAIPLGYTFGRLGNFINGELWGRVTTASWGMIFPHAQPFSTRHEWVRSVADTVGISYREGELINLPRHPSQLYEAFLEGILLWVILWFFLRKRALRIPGMMLSSYLIGYGTARFLVEYVREPDADLGFIIQWGSEHEPAALFHSLLNISMGQILSFLMIAAGIILLFIFHNRAVMKGHVSAR